MTCTLLTIALLLLTTPAWAYEGWGASAIPGVNVYTVTNLNDAGPGSLRDAVSIGNRNVRFAVAGNIVPTTGEIRVRGSRVLIDGLSAPAPGITLNGRGIIVRGTEGANNVIIRGLRIYNAAFDGIQIADGAYNVVVDKVTIGYALDGAIDVTNYAQYVTISNSLLAGDKVSLLKFGGLRVTYHHNFMVGNQRIPLVSSEGVPPTDVHADIRNNIIVEVSPPTLHGTLVQFDGVANVINNLYIGPRGRDVVVVQSPYVYVAGNVMYAGSGSPNGFGTWFSPLPSPPVATQSACAGAGLAANAGPPFADDSFEAGLVAWVWSYAASLPAGQGC